MEAALRALGHTGLDWGEKFGVLSLVSGYVVQTSRLDADLRRSRAERGLDQAQTQRAYGRALAALIDPDRFPEVTNLLASGLFERLPAEPSDLSADDPGSVFGLERLLDGIEAAIGS